MYSSKIFSIREHKHHIQHRIFQYKENIGSGHNVFISHIITMTPVKSSNTLLTSQAEMQNMIVLAEHFPNIAIMNATIYSILEIKGNLKVLPDLKMLDHATEQKKKIERELGVRLNGIVLIIPKDRWNKYIRFLFDWSTNVILRKGFNIKIANDYESALKAIDEFIIDQRLDK